jgi:exodeoxyribonuclease V alpha subunit
MASSNFNVHSAFANYFSKDELNPWLYLLSQSMDAGNVCLDTEEKIIESEGQSISKDILQKHKLVGTPGAIKPFIFNNKKLYLHRFFTYEEKLVAAIKGLCKQPVPPERITFLKSLHKLINESLFPTNSLDKLDWQKVACINAFTQKITIISGGPGTGKTTTVTKLLCLNLLENPSLKIQVCAPTGKASARLQESISQAHKNLDQSVIDKKIIDTITAIQPKTIHSLLGYIPNSVQFKHNANNCLDTDILIVDECSMIDMAMFYKLFQAIDINRTRVILLGDKNQLASVDAGSVFRDLCTETAPVNTFSKEQINLINEFIANPSQQLTLAHTSSESHPLSGHIIELQTSYRFNDEQGIGKLSKAILYNDKDSIRHFYNNEDPLVQIYQPEQMGRAVDYIIECMKEPLKGYAASIDLNTSLSRMSHTSVLCAVKEGKYGVHAVNNSIAQQLFRPSEMFYPYQLIMVTQNQASEGVYNGDMGMVWEDKNHLSVYFPKGQNTYLQLNPAQLLSWDTAFAMTIHKSQGSEFDEILIILPDNKENLLLTRELLYTAITRAKQKVNIVGSLEIIETIAAQTVKRVSGIADHF